MNDDPRAGHFGRVPDELGPPLSERAVNELPDRTPVVVIWSGGNGPHRYLVHQPGAFVVGERDWGNPRMMFYNPLSFVGAEHFHTRVWSPVDAQKPPPAG